MSVRATPLNVTFDCAEAAKAASFWSQLTGWPATFEDMPGNPYWVVADPTGALPRLVFVTVGEEKARKNRVHLDLLPTDGSQEEVIELALQLGASVLEDRRSLEPGGWVVLADPEGNEFCLEGS
jgi:predicted enzyme related to lactoylglutathione lyase